MAIRGSEPGESAARIDAGGELIELRLVLLRLVHRDLGKRALPIAVEGAGIDGEIVEQGGTLEDEAEGMAKSAAIRIPGAVHLDQRPIRAVIPGGVDDQRQPVR